MPISFQTSPYRTFSQPRFAGVEEPRLQVQAQEIQALMGQLGVESGRQASPGGLVPMNEPLVNKIAGFREQAIPYLAAFFSCPRSPVALAEGIYAAQKMAENRVPGVEALYAPLSRYNASPNPLIQTYLAGFYRTIDEPAAFGPMLGTLIHQSLYNYPSQGDPNGNISEEVGGAVLKMLARESSKETVKALRPYLPQLQAARPETGKPS